MVVEVWVYFCGSLLSVWESLCVGLCVCVCCLCICVCLYLGLTVCGMGTDSWWCGHNGAVRVHSSLWIDVNQFLGMRNLPCNTGIKNACWSTSSPSSLPHNVVLVWAGLVTFMDMTLPQPSPDFIFVSTAIPAKMYRQNYPIYWWEFFAVATRPPKETLLLRNQNSNLSHSVD